MAKRELPDAELLRKLLDYNPTTGELRWRPRPPEFFDGSTRRADWQAKAWNGKWADKLAQSVNDQGYVVLAVARKMYAAHRIIWAMVHGYQPSEIDHINGDRSDNRISNLREVTRAQNSQNRARPANNKSGTIGVHWLKKTGVWRASIKVGGRLTWLGQFEKLEDAVAARKAAECEAGFHENHGRELNATRFLESRLT